MNWFYILILTPVLSFGQAVAELSSQQQLLVVGNSARLCFPNDSIIAFSDSLPALLDDYDAIFLFSTAGNGFKDKEIDELVTFISGGGGLYIGADNAPLQTESNQLTDRLFKKTSYGNYPSSRAESAEAGVLRLKELDSIPAGQSIVAFPLDYRLQVEAWIDDQPLILSGKVDAGRILIDGGYSRFYCACQNEVSAEIFLRMVQFLCREE